MNRDDLACWVVFADTIVDDGRIGRLQEVRTAVPEICVLGHRKVKLLKEELARRRIYQKRKK